MRRSESTAIVGSRIEPCAEEAVGTVVIAGAGTAEIPSGFPQAESEVSSASVQYVVLIMGSGSVESGRIVAGILPSAMAREGLPTPGRDLRRHALRTLPVRWVVARSSYTSDRLNGTSSALAARVPGPVAAAYTRFMFPPSTAKTWPSSIPRRTRPAARLP